MLRVAAPHCCRRSKTEGKKPNPKIWERETRDGDGLDLSSLLSPRPGFRFSVFAIFQFPSSGPTQGPCSFPQGFCYVFLALFPFLSLCSALCSVVSFSIRSSSQFLVHFDFFDSSTCLIRKSAASIALLHAVLTFELWRLSSLGANSSSEESGSSQ